jgi:hypothetical protein
MFKLTHYKNALLKDRALISTILVCFDACVCTFSYWVFCPSYLWDSHIPHHATINLLNYMNILQNLKKVKGVTIQYVEYLVRNMVGFLYYVKYKESNKTYLLLASKRFIQQSLNLDNYCVKLLCYHSMGNVNGMAEMLTLMNSFITENEFTTKSSCVYFNMFT